MTLVENARQAWRWGSVQLAVVAGWVIGAIADDPTILPRAVALAPAEWRPYIGPLIGIVSAACAISSRVIRLRAA